MRDVAVIGAGMTRFGKYLDRGMKDLTREAVDGALGCAGAGRTGFQRRKCGAARDRDAEDQHHRADRSQPRVTGSSCAPLGSCASRCICRSICHSGSASSRYRPGRPLI